MPTKSYHGVDHELHVQAEEPTVAVGRQEVIQAQESSQPTKENRIRLKWEERVAQLRAFRAKHGHVDVPRTYTKDPTLGTFVCNQRQTYKRMNEGKGPSMDRLRVHQLNELGFKWVLKHKDQPALVESDDEDSDVDRKQAAKAPKPKPLAWEVGMQQLRAFQLSNGNLDIPHIYAADQPLGNFVKSIRQSYKNIQKGQYNLNKLLNDERIFELNSMGFKLQVRQREPWEQRFEELKKHVKRHGNCEVPKDTPLGVWILNQRSQFKLMLARKKTSLSQQRINSLNSIGFDWRVNLKDGDTDQVYVHDDQDDFLHGDSAEPSENACAVPDFSGVAVRTEYWTDDSDSEDFRNTGSATDMPALEQPNLVLAYPYPYHENIADMGNFNGFNSFNTQYAEQFAFKTSPNGRRVSEDSRADADDADDADDSDMKPSAVVSSSYVDHPYTNHEFNLQPNQHAPALPTGFDFESNQQSRDVSGFGDGFSHANASSSASAPYHNADTFVDSLLNDDFSGHDFSGHDFAGNDFQSNPFVTEDDEAQGSKGYEYEQVVEI